MTLGFTAQITPAIYIPLPGPDSLTTKGSLNKRTKDTQLSSGTPPAGIEPAASKVSGAMGQRPQLNNIDYHPCLQLNPPKIMKVIP